MSNISSAWTRFRGLKSWQQWVIALGVLAVVGSFLPETTSPSASARPSSSSDDSAIETTNSPSASAHPSSTSDDSASETGTCRKPSTVEYCTTKEAAVAAGERFAARSSINPTGFCVRQNGEWEAADGGWNHYLSTDGDCDKPTHEYHPVTSSTPTTSGSYTRTTEPELVTCPDALETLAKRPGWGNDGFVRGVDALYDPAMDWDGDGVSCE